MTNYLLSFINVRASKTIIISIWALNHIFQKHNRLHIQPHIIQTISKQPDNPQFITFPIQHFISINIKFVIQLKNNWGAVFISKYFPSYYNRVKTHNMFVFLDFNSTIIFWVLEIISVSSFQKFNLCKIIQIISQNMSFSITHNPKYIYCKTIWKTSSSIRITLKRASEGWTHFEFIQDSYQIFPQLALHIPLRKLTWILGLWPSIIHLKPLLIHIETNWN